MNYAPQTAYKARRAASGTKRTEVVLSPSEALKLDLLASMWGLSKNQTILKAIDLSSSEGNRREDEIDMIVAALIEADSELVACSEYLDPMVDADGDSEGFHGNREMTLQSGVNSALRHIEIVLRQLNRLTATHHQ